MPRLAFINKMDKVGASFASRGGPRSAERLGARPVAVQIPIGEEAAHREVIDLVRMKAITFDDETKGAAYRVTEVPEEMLPAARQARAELIEACAELDDTVLARFVEDRVEAITDSDIEGALRRARSRCAPCRCSADRLTGTRGFKCCSTPCVPTCPRLWTCRPRAAVRPAVVKRPSVLRTTTRRSARWRSR